jgi:flagellar FliL protein
MKSKPLILIIIILVIAIGVIFAGFSMGWFSKGESQAQSPKKAEAVKELTYSLGDFTCNLNEANYKRYIAVKLSVGYTKEGLDKTLEEKLPQMSDIVNSVLRAKKIDDLNTTEKTESVKKEIMDKINAILGDDKITNVYFNKILIQ